MAQNETIQPWRPDHPAEHIRPANDPVVPIPTEAEWQTWRRMVPRIRRAIRAGIAKGRPWDRAATVDEIAGACHLTAHEVVRMITMCGWFIAVNEDAEKIGQRTVYELRRRRRD